MKPKSVSVHWKNRLPACRLRLRISRVCRVLLLIVYFLQHWILKQRISSFPSLPAESKETAEQRVIALEEQLSKANADQSARTGATEEEKERLSELTEALKKELSQTQSCVETTTETPTHALTHSHAHSLFLSTM